MRGCDQPWPQPERSRPRLMRLRIAGRAGARGGRPARRMVGRPVGRPCDRAFRWQRPHSRRRRRPRPTAAAAEAEHRVWRHVSPKRRVFGCPLSAGAVFSIPGPCCVLPVLVLPPRALPSALRTGPRCAHLLAWEVDGPQAVRPEGSAVFCLLCWLLRLLGLRVDGARGACDIDPAARARWAERRRQFRRKMREAFDVWREDDAPAQTAPAAAESGMPARPADPLED